MTELLPLLLLLLLVLAVVGAVLLLRQLQAVKVSEAQAIERYSAKEAEVVQLREELVQLDADKNSLQGDLQRLREDQATTKTSLELERKQFEEKLTLLNESREQLSTSFKNIANEIFADKTKTFADTSKQTLNNVLGPLQKKITDFEKRVEETYDKESKERFSLVREIKSLQELNNRISEEAVNLTNALKGDNKAQGSWGEFVLESILEKSGLVKGREYEAQVSLKSEDGSNYQPDVVVHLPESKDIIIDSKVSLIAWDRFCSAESSEEKAEFLKQHTNSIRAHVNALSNKDYQQLAGVNSLDYVFLFMPIEAAYTAAAQEDRELMQYAFDRNIIIVVPTTLLTTLRTVQNLWRLAQQNQNATKIAKQAGALYDKFVNFVDDLDEIGQRIDASRKSFDKARNRLVSGRGNLIRKVENLRELGAKTSKTQKAPLLEESLDEDTESAAEPKDNGIRDETTRQ